MITRWLALPRLGTQGGQPGSGIQRARRLSARSQARCFSIALPDCFHQHQRCPHRPGRRTPTEPARMEDLGRQVMDVRDQAAQAIDFMLADLRQKWAELSGGPSMTEGLRRFIAAVDWSVSELLGGAGCCCGNRHQGTL